VLLLSLNTTLLTLLADPPGFARMLMRGVLVITTVPLAAVPLGVNVTMSAPVSALNTVNDATVWAVAQTGAMHTTNDSAEVRQKFLVIFLTFQ
jgi:hypothetical protein